MHWPVAGNEGDSVEPSIQVCCCMLCSAMLWSWMCSCRHARTRWRYHTVILAIVLGIVCAEVLQQI